MSAPTQTEHENQSFAETALRLSGKSEEEARRTGAMDKADEQVEQLFAPQYKTVNSPVHRAVWDKEIPLDQFLAPEMPASAPFDPSMDKSGARIRTANHSHENPNTPYASTDAAKTTSHSSLRRVPTDTRQSRFGRSLTTISTLTISNPSGGAGRLVTRTGASGMSNTLFSPSMKKW